MNDYTWPPYPEPPHIAHMRASIEAVREHRSQSGAA